MRMRNVSLGTVIAGLVFATIILPATLDLMVTAAVGGAAFWMGRRSVKD